jgi:hypothetical protein
MELNNIDISKLPADVRRKYKQLQVMHAEKKIQNKAKDDFLSFVKCMWPDFIEGSHHRHIAEKFNKLATGEINRLIVNMPRDILSRSLPHTYFRLGWWAVSQG